MAKENATPAPVNETAIFDADDEQEGKGSASDDFFNEDQGYEEGDDDPPYGVPPSAESIDDDVAHEGPTGEGAEKEPAEDPDGTDEEEGEDGEVEEEEEEEGEDEAEEEEEGDGEELDDASEEDESEEEDSPETNARHPQSLHEVTVNGESGTVTYDQLVVGFQKGAAADQRFEAAAEKEQGAKGVLQKLANKDAVLDNLVDFWATAVTGDRLKAEEMLDEVIAERVAKQLEREQMTPDQRRIAELEEEQERYKADYDRKEAANAQERAERLARSRDAAAVKAMDTALDAGGHPHDGPISEALANRLVTLISQGHDIDDRIAGAVLQEVVVEQRELLQRSVAGMTPEQLAEVNPELAAAVKKKNIEKLRKRKKATNRSGTNRRGSTRGTPEATPDPRRRDREGSRVGPPNYEDFFNDGDE